MGESVLLKLHLILTTPAAGIDSIITFTEEKTEAKRSKVV